jgi:hypothetical protein
LTKSSKRACCWKLFMAVGHGGRPRRFGLDVNGTLNLTRVSALPAT